MTTQGPTNPDSLITQVKRLLLPQLKVVAKYLGQQVSGPKASLQQRIITQIHVYASRNDIDSLNSLRQVVFHPEQNHLSHGTPPLPAARSFQTDPRQQQNSYQQPYNTGSSRPTMPSTNGTTAPRNPVFKASPFYNVIQPLTSVLEMKVREQTRDNVQAIISLREDTINSLLQDSTVRVMVFCAADSLHSPFQRVDIAFPYQVEIRVNQDEVKANLRGLKNKPGTTRPADITTNLRKRAGYENHLQVTWALTTKKFFLVVNLVRQQPVSELVTRLKSSNKKISKERVINEMKSRAEDSDIVATSSILSLKCPLSTLRIDVPCRSTLCTHNQCFDATSFLQLQEQAPTWTCPICQKVFSFENLEIDQYVDEILKLTPKSLDQVTVEPDGRWSQTSSGARSPRLSHGRASSPDYDDEDLVEIKDVPQLDHIKRENTSDGNLLRTPPVSSREVSTPSAVPLHSSGSNKRPATQVVDLTLSSDEDDEPIRPSKRQTVQKPSHTPSFSSDADNLPLRPNGLINDISNTQHSYPVNPFQSTSYL